MGPGSVLTIRRVDEIPPEKSGKYRYVVSRVPFPVPRTSPRRERVGERALILCHAQLTRLRVSSRAAGHAC